jgi:hypothetical protein
MSAPALVREVIVFPKDQIEELKLCCQAMSASQEGGINYLLLERLALPLGCSPAKIDALLCPTPRDAYPSRLFFEAQVQSPFARNWNFNGRAGKRPNQVSFSGAGLLRCAPRGSETKGSLHGGWQELTRRS